MPTHESNCRTKKGAPLPDGNLPWLKYSLEVFILFCSYMFEFNLKNIYLPVNPNNWEDAKMWTEPHYFNGRELSFISSCSKIVLENFPWCSLRISSCKLLNKYQLLGARIRGPLTCRALIYCSSVNDDFACSLQEENKFYYLTNCRFWLEIPLSGIINATSHWFYQFIIGKSSQSVSWC